MGYFLVVAALVALPMMAIWLAKRDRSRERHWGDHSSQSSIMVGAEIDMPRILPVEPAPGLTASGSPIEDLSHRAEPDSGSF